MRFPYLGVARVKYLLSMHEHRRWVNRSDASSALSEAPETRDAAGLPVGPRTPNADTGAVLQTPALRQADAWPVR